MFQLNVLEDQQNKTNSDSVVQVAILLLYDMKRLNVVMGIFLILRLGDILQFGKADHKLVYFCPIRRLQIQLNGCSIVDTISVSSSWYMLL